MSKKRLEINEISVESFTTEGVSRQRGTIRANIADAFANGEAAPTVIAVCTKAPNYTCDGSMTCSGIETCDGDASCPLGCPDLPHQNNYGGA